MRVLSIGTDRNILKDDTAVSVRAAAYAEEFGALDVIVFSKKGFAPAQFAEAGHAYPTNSRYKLLYLFGALGIARTLEKPDVVTVQDPFESGLVGLLIAHVLGVPLHVQAHTDFLAPTFRRASILNRIRARIASLVLRRACRVRVVSERIKDELVEKAGVTIPVSVLPIYVDTVRYTDLARTKHPRFMVSLVCIGRLEKEKNFTLAIDALKRARDAKYDAGLTVVGSGSQQEALAAYAESQGVGQWVEWAGWHADLAPYLSHADIVLVPSLYEGYGMVIIEALSAGVPVLSTDVGIAQEAGAIVTSRRDFAPALVRWIQAGPRKATLVDYPYGSFEEYVHKYCADISSCVKTA
jgi:glycosyltransferase involved in cell wall biosynthesis